MSWKPPFSTVESLEILIDSASIEDLLLRSDSFAKRLVSYQDSNPFRFVRSNLPTVDVSLMKIPQVEMKTGDNQVSFLQISNGERSRGIMFGYRMQDVETVGRTVYGKNNLTSDELNSILLVFFERILTEHNRYGLLVTENKVLLRHSGWFESHFPGGLLNIVDIQEALARMDIFAKLRDAYYVSANYPTVNKGYWYTLSFSCKIPHYDSSTKIMEAFRSRFRFLLTSIDEIGSQFYLGANNDTMDNSLYHFNYFILLASGIFDSLAIETKDKLDLQFRGQTIPARTFLYREAGGEFRRALTHGKHVSLLAHIKAADAFLELIRELREAVLHREGLHSTAVVYRGDDARWQGNFFRPAGNVAALINSYETSNLNNSRPFRWGPYISPYHFAKALAQTLIRFADEYLTILGFDDSIAKLNPDDEYRKLIERFQVGKLGF